MDRLAGRTALVTGAARGQGAAEAGALAALGAAVVIADVLEDEGRALAGQLEGSRFVHLDVSSEDSWRAAVIACESLPPLGVLVNNAGVEHRTALVDETLAGFEQVVRVNLVGAFLGIRAAVPLMRAAGGGSIINVASTAAVRGYAGLGAYSSSKWALRGLTRTAALELGADRIRVNCVLPGAIDTAMMSTPADHPRFQAFPLRRPGQPDEVARLVAFLACEDSAYITGAEIVIDGGATA